MRSGKEKLESLCWIKLLEMRLEPAGYMIVAKPSNRGLPSNRSSPAPIGLSINPAQHCWASKHTCMGEHKPTLHAALALFSTPEHNMHCELGELRPEVKH